MKLSFFAVALFSLLAAAHDGHDHDGPKNLKAPKGGVIKSLEQTHLELVAKGKEIKIYLYDKDLKPQTLTDFKVKAQAELPRSKKREDISLSQREGFYEGSFDAKGAHRYTLILAVTDPKEGHEDTVKFTVEPRK